MQTRKPGRFLFWASMSCWSFGWLFAAINYSVERNANTAVVAVFLWGSGAFTGTLWLIVKMWQILCRVRVQSVTVEGRDSAAPIVRTTAKSGFTPRDLLAGIGIALAVGFVAICSYVVFTLETSGRVAKNPVVPLGVTQPQPPAQKHRARHPSRQPSPDPEHSTASN